MFRDGRLPLRREDFMQLHYFDVRRFPLVVATPPHVEVPLELEAFLRDWDVFLVEWDFLLRRGRHALLLDLRGTSPLLTGAAVVRELAPYLERRCQLIAPTLVAEARVVSSVAMRGVLTMLDRLVGEDLTHPRATFRSLAEADEWLMKGLSADSPTAVSERVAPPARERARADGRNGDGGAFDGPTALLPRVP